MPAYQMVMFIVSLLAPIIGTAIARSAGSTVALIVAAALHAVGALLFIGFKIGHRFPATTP
jgi:dipeptide/tripeptide permease